MAISPMIERAARVLATQDGKDADYTGLGMGGDPAWMFYVYKVRALFEAIREPSEEMQRSIDAHRMAGHVDDATSRLYWNKMVEAALAE